MRILHVSFTDLGGGAARAAMRLHTRLVADEIDSRMLVGAARTDISSVNGPTGRFRKGWSLARPLIADYLLRFQHPADSALRSLAWLPSSLHDSDGFRNADVINLHWVCGELMSIRDIGLIRRPCVWTMHDMWPFCGAEHVSVDQPDSRWRIGYRRENRPRTASGLDLDYWVWRRKQRAWRTPMHVVTPSRWLGRCVSESSLMKDWPVSIIPNALDTALYRPWPKALARRILGLPLDIRLVLFGSADGGRDPNKGWDVLQDALNRLASAGVVVECMILGRSEPPRPPSVGLPLHWLGRLSDDATLSLVYSAADVTVVPSRIENLPQSATEAQSCGCPVVAFNCTGLPDVVEHGVTGYLAQPYDPIDLASGIRWVLADIQRLAVLGAAARERAVRLWSSTVVVSQYLDAYAEAIDAYNRHSL